MTIHLLLFGPLADAAKTNRLPITLPPGHATCAALRAQLHTQAPALAPYLRACRFAINHAFVDDAHPIHPTDEVALIGMVSGG